MSDTPITPADPEPAPLRVFFGGILMGMANLVPGVSGGTMILALGLYDRFINAVAEATGLRWSGATIRFLAMVVAGAALAFLVLSGPAVWLVTEQRWIAYSLFVGLTLGGAPALWRSVRPLGIQEIAAGLIGLALMVGFAFGMSATALPVNFLALTIVGAIAASSMILPGISGSYILLIFGLYDLVVGSIRPSALMADFAGSLGILIPIGIGIAIGIGGLSNVLKVFLVRFERPTHAALLGLLLGSALGLWPFQESGCPELSSRARLQAVQLVLEETPLVDIAEETGVSFTEVEAAELSERYAGMGRGDLRLAAMKLERYAPSGFRVALSLALLAAGFFATGVLGTRRTRKPVD